MGAHNDGREEGVSTRSPEGKINSKIACGGSPGSAPDRNPNSEFLRLHIPLASDRLSTPTLACAPAPASSTALPPNTYRSLRLCNLQGLDAVILLTSEATPQLQHQVVQQLPCVQRGWGVKKPIVAGGDP